jgi:signal peptidase I
MDGYSMYPTIKNGKFICVKKIKNNLEVWDIVLFEYEIEDNESIFYIKRIVWVPWNTIEIKNWELIINDNIVDESIYSKYYELEKMKKNYEKITLMENEYFVLGDNRNKSKDSRYFWAIHSDKIIWKYINTYDFFWEK